MHISSRRFIGALILLCGCAGNVGDSERAADGPGPIAPESDVSAEPAAQVAAASAACPAGTARPPASDLRIREIALYQTVKVPLVQNGAWVATRPVIVVQNKKALVRVFVDTVTGYRPRPLRGVLTLQNGATPTELISNRTLAVSSTDEVAGSTFTFEVPAAAIGPSAQFSVALTEPGRRGGAAAVAGRLSGPP